MSTTSDRHATERAAALLHSRIGLNPDTSFRPRLTRALRDVAHSRGVDGGDLVESLLADGTALDDLVDRVTVQETAFFRHPEQFEALVSEIVPRLEKPLSAWSAACANGQEAYSLAMMLREATPQAAAPPRVLATDISPAALARAESGRYSEREMKGVSAARRGVHFTAAAQQWRVRPEVRKLLTLQRHNLLDPIPDEVANCQIVMCRNVLIYFSQRHAASFLDRLADAMQPGSYLFVGGAETLWQITDRFEPIQLGACFVYQRRGATVRPALPTAKAASTLARPRPVVAGPTQPVAAAPRARVAPIVTTVVNASPDELEARGRAALVAGDAADAIVAFRGWAYLAPDDPLAHFHLGSTLATAGEVAGARRAFRAALAALERCDDEQASRCVQGYDVSELRRLLVTRCTTSTFEAQPPTAQPARSAG